MTVTMGVTVTIFALTFLISIDSRMRMRLGVNRSPLLVPTLMVQMRRRVGVEVW
jgi:hypothetical protein